MRALNIFREPCRMVRYLSAITCDEEDGNEIVPGVGDTAHTVMIRESGQCPWCGDTQIS